MLKLGPGALELLDPGWVHRMAWRIASYVLKLVNKYSRAAVHAFDRDGGAIVVGG